MKSFIKQAHHLASLAYDGVAAVGALIASGNNEALTREALTQSAGFEGVNGIFRFQQNGTNRRGLAIAQVVNKEVVIIDPAPKTFGFSSSGQKLDADSLICPSETIFDLAVFEDIFVRQLTNPETLKRKRKYL